MAWAGGYSVAKALSRWTDQYVEEWIGTPLRVGVTSAAAVVLFGGVVYLVRHGREVPQFHVFKGEPRDLRTVPGIVKEVLDFRGRGLIQLGLLLLIATPVARVAFSLAAFALQRDRLYVLVTLIVLVVLVYSLAAGRA
jgi:uncharacterized membrane protein